MGLAVITKKGALQTARSAAAMIRRLIADPRASVSIDFVVSIPILLAALILTTEYGRVLQMRSTLDNAVADAARYLSRVPENPDGGGFPVGAVEIAEALIRARLSVDALAISAPALGTAGGFPTVSLSAAAGIRSPALGALVRLAPGDLDEETVDGLRMADIDGLVVRSSNTIRHFGR